MIQLTPDQRRPIFQAARDLGVKFNTQAKVDRLDLGITESLALLGIAAAVAPPSVVTPTPLPSSGLVTLDGLPWRDMLALLTNTSAPALTEADFQRAADELGHGVTPKHMKASKKVEAPRGAFDDDGRPSILYERHVFARNTSPKGRFNATHPNLSALRGYGPGGYGAFSAQYGKLGLAYALDPEAAFEGCSWGAFQVLGENAVACGYASARAMAVELAKSEAAHLDSYVRFIKANGLADELGRCKAGDPASCIPFVEVYNGSGFRKFSYHIKFAEALR
jgi:hypothetical protein